MEDTSNSSSDSDNALLSTNKNPSVGTQTPQMSRHDMKQPRKEKNLPRPPEIQLQLPNQNLNSSIVVYKLDTQTPMSELEQQAKTLAIPDVVVEYIKDSCNLQDGLGATNPAFEPQELIVVRTPSSISLRDDIARENGMELFSGAGGKDQIEASSMMLNVLNPSLRASQVSLRCPSPTFGYRPLESETSAVYTIIKPMKYAVNEKEVEMRLLAQLQAQMEKEKATARKFEFSSIPPEVDRKRQRLQYVTDVSSILFLIPGILIAVVTPITIIPMFILPLKYFVPLIAIFVASGIVSVLAFAISGFLGNVVWHYDCEKKKLRPKLHCGTGPLRHFWGNGFYPGYQIVLEPDKLV